MTALAGLWHIDGMPGAEVACGRMLAAQAIYGPHGEAIWSDGAIALGRRLFRTLPEDVHDRGPIAARDGALVLVADVRLDNRDELGAALGLAGGMAAQMADADILLAAWERWAENCFDRLVGDYAFALWDGAARRLVLARDPLGQRPLHYHRGNGFFAFAGMPKGLHALPQIARAPDEERIAEFLAFLPERGTRTFFADVARVEAGHFTVVTAASVSTHRHWNPVRRTLRLANDADYAEGLRHHLDTAVRAQMRRTAKDIGSHLSAGYDSTIIATSAARQLAPGERLVAFTAVPRIGYAEAAPAGRICDEGAIAAATAAFHPNMEHVLIRTPPGRSPLDTLARNVELYDQPILSICNQVWRDALNDAARERGIGVMLSGGLGNLTLSYGGETLLPQLMLTGRWLRWLAEGRGLVHHTDVRWRRVLSATFGPFVPQAPWQWLNRIVRGHATGMAAFAALRPEQLPAIAAKARARAYDIGFRPSRDSFSGRIGALRHNDNGNIVKGILGGWGIDQRNPAIDRRLIEFTLAVPDDQVMIGGQTKALTRRAFADRLAEPVLNARRRGYQAADWHEALSATRGALRDEIARIAACTAAADVIDVARLERLVDAWPAGGWESPAVMAAYRFLLLRAVSAGNFARRAGGEPA